MRSLSTIELIIILGWENADIEPMLHPTEISIPQGYAAIIIAIAEFKMYDYFTTKYRRFSKMIVAKPILLWKDGKILENVWWILEFKRRISIIFET